MTTAAFSSSTTNGGALVQLPAVDHSWSLAQSDSLVTDGQAQAQSAQ